MDEKEHKLKSLIVVLPDKPGVYLFYDVNGTVIYVGKAKNLKKRVASYFKKNLENGKTKVLVRKITDIKQLCTLF